MQIQLLDAQHDFITSESPKALLLAGIGYGKSFIGAHFVINMISKYPNSKGLITANTYTQLVNATVTTLLAEFQALGITYKAVLGGAKKLIEVLGTTIYLYSLERPDNIRGIEVGWWWSDESAFSDKEAIQICRGRLRQKRSPLFERHTTSPNGYNWCYEEFENKDGENKTNSHALFRGVTKENIFLPNGYYESLLADYGGENNPLARQELFGQFVNMHAGAIYWGFDRKIHVSKIKLRKGYPVYIGQDFNVNNMSSVYVQHIDGVFYVTSEQVLDHYGSNTDTACQLHVTNLKEYEKYIIPDSTGKAIKTNSRGRSDLDIIRSYNLQLINTINPFVRDRQNTMNINFKKNKIIIDESCVNLIRELETINSRDKEGDVSHVAVGLGYVVFRMSPIIPPRRSTQS